MIMDIINYLKSSSLQLLTAIRTAALNSFNSVPLVSLTADAGCKMINSNAENLLDDLGCCWLVYLV